MNSDEHEAESSELIRALHQLLLGTDDLEDFLSGVAGMACKLAEPPCNVTVSVGVGGRTRTVGSSDGPVPAVPSLALPLVLREVEVGRLNVYVDGGRRGIPGPDRHALEWFAAQATPVITLAIRRTEQQNLTDQLVAAMTSRTVIDQAIGVLMAQDGCTAEEAFALLRRHSQANNRKLRDVAVELVTRVTGHPPSDPKPFQLSNVLRPRSDVG